MSPKEQNWFNLIREQRINDVETLVRLGFLEVFINLIIDTYRESAHFIFELLQNADDVQATKVRIELNQNGLIFAHNGKIGFSISDPAVERNPGIQPGHLNSITTFSLSTKKEDVENKIGKFGIGFKSVFQYTRTPHIYNPPYCFKIEDYMVPGEISLEPTMLKKGETTAFYLPFDNTEKPAELAFAEIFEKLGELTNPLLFLRNIIQFEWQAPGGASKVFTKKIQSNAVSESDQSIEVFDCKLDEQKFLRFDRYVFISDAKGKSHNLKVSLAFILSKSGDIVADPTFESLSQSAYCFFPTNQSTGLRYIIHAPFILTPNRAELKEKRTENVQLVKAVAELLCDTLPILKILGKLNEGFFTTIPQTEEGKGEFKIISQKIISCLKSGEFVPTPNGNHIHYTNAFICTEPHLAQLLSLNSCNPLKKLVNNHQAQIVFQNQALFRDANLFTFISKELSATGAGLQALWLGSKITTEFLKQMSQSWLLEFFEYLQLRESQIFAKNQSLVKKAFIPIQPENENENGEFEFIAPLDMNGHPQVYLSGKPSAKHKVAASFLLQNEAARKLFTNLGLRDPDEFDILMHEVIPKYIDPEPKVSQNDAVEDFIHIISFLFNSRPKERAEVISKLNGQECYWLLKRQIGEKPAFINPCTVLVYYPLKDLKDYFSGKEDVNWFSIEEYEIENKYESNNIQLLLTELEIYSYPYIWAKTYENPNEELLSKYNIKGERSTNGKTTIRDFKLDGLENIFNRSEGIDLSISIYLSKVIERIGYSFLECVYTWQFYGSNIKKGSSTLGTQLREFSWVFTKKLERRNPTEIEISEIHPDYPEAFKLLLLYLGARKEDLQERLQGLTEEERLRLERSKLIEELGLNWEEAEDLLRKGSQEKRKRQNKALIPPGADGKLTGENYGDLLEGMSDELLDLNERIKKENDFTGGDSVRLPKQPTPLFIGDEEIQEEQDDWVPVAIDPMDNIGGATTEKKKNELLFSIELEARRMELLERLKNATMYSFSWFCILLELEDSYTTEDRVKRTPISVSFGKAELDSDGILLLSETPSVPQAIEDIGELQIALYLGDERITVVSEVVSPQKQTLKVKLKNPEALNKFDLTKLTRAVVQVSSPDFILEKLKIAFAGLPFQPDQSLHNNLPNTLSFVLGPPGTGKTTYLSWFIGGKQHSKLLFNDIDVVPLMESNLNRVLVLTPTNKAADVLTERIIKNYEDSDEYPDWLIRFGETKSNQILNSPIYVKNRVVPYWIKEKATLITTIVRFPYDQFNVIEDGEDVENFKIRDFDWNFIIFDEASMISLASMLYVIYHARTINPDVQFLVGGDPFQIHPILQFEWPGWSYLVENATKADGTPRLRDDGQAMEYHVDAGNIYSMVGLMKDDSFFNPQTTPHKFPIHQLKTQFRSIAPVGNLFSMYRYGGKLLHDRTGTNMENNTQKAVKEIQIKDLPLKPLTIMHFPVKKHESLYRARAIKGSPYQIYSALFTVELLNHIQNHAILNPESPYRIGVICPYRIQENIISKLLERTVKGSLEIVTGTVHGFQGDECDMVIVLLNPPVNITRSPRSFLNKKNILNVAISRARDCLILLVPMDGDGKVNVGDLHQIKRIKSIVRTTPDIVSSKVEYITSNLEESLFQSCTFIDDSSFPTAHQAINVYATPEKKYEVRFDENALDVQVKY